MFGDLIDGQSGYKVLFDTVKGIADFASRALPDYDSLKAFYDTNRENFKELSPEDQQKAAEIDTFLRSNDPRKEFRHARKAKDELDEALKKLITKLATDIKSMYTDIYVELEAEADKRGVARSAYPDKGYLLDRIQRLHAINSLKREELNAPNFKADALRQIIAATPAKAGRVANEPQAYYVSAKASTISTEAELDAYLQKLRKEMLDLLNDNKTIILK